MELQRMLVGFALAAMGSSAFAIELVNQCTSNGFTLIAESDHFEVCTLKEILKKTNKKKMG